MGMVEETVVTTAEVAGTEKVMATVAVNRCKTSINISIKINTGPSRMSINRI